MSDEEIAKVLINRREIAKLQILNNIHAITDRLKTLSDNINIYGLGGQTDNIILEVHNIVEHVAVYNILLNFLPKDK